MYKYRTYSALLGYGVVKIANLRQNTSDTNYIIVINTIRLVIITYINADLYVYECVFLGYGGSKVIWWKVNTRDSTTVNSRRRRESEGRERETGALTILRKI